MITSLINNINSIKNARFEKNGNLIYFFTDSHVTFKNHIMCIYPIKDYNLANYLNNSIKPIIDRYIKIYENELEKNSKFI